uniref:Uncharacterized protein n=1 Tax=Alexandrium monilatum TaxID=311494 RepID=A0A7S4VAU1_9DINO|mmetsp:Transcript_100444/g.299686  ORF Transcript_100444/g.299686 Transcript_100444/m.299686 type:complete len:371 (-) Transcript_100444:238-1350(-)
MPIFEEKLICPLAVRFTQEHIRPVFQDGRTLESTIAAISTRSGTGDYDVILETPFPSIEVVRWRQRDGGSKGSADGKEWVTLDNRRLYCLQRAAAALWPRRVAVVVEVLYAATEGILRKCDSSTAGRSVGIGHSPKALTGRWEWQEAVALDGPKVHAAHALVAADNSRTCVEELLDAPAAPSMLDLFLQGADLPLCKATIDTLSEDSTTMPSSPRSHGSSEHWWPAEALVGKWTTGQGEVYEITAVSQGVWSCKRVGGKNHSQRFPLVYHEPSDAVWWGDLNLCLDGTEARHETGSIQWYATSDNRRRRPRFLWCRSEAPAKQAQSGRRGRAKKEAQETAPAATPATLAATPVGEPAATKRPARPRRQRV